MISFSLGTSVSNPKPSLANPTTLTLPTRSSYSTSIKPSFFPLKPITPPKAGKLGLCSNASPWCSVTSNHRYMSPELSSKAEEAPLKIGVIGFGNFGQFIARRIKHQGHVVLATSRSDYSEYCNRHGVKFFGSIDEMCEEQPDVVLVCSSILSTESVVRGIPFHKLRPDTIFADVLSIKQFPRDLFLEVLPPEFGIVCTHPMFGPESGKRGWAGLAFVYDQVRIARGTAQARKCARLLNIFEREGCRMVEMSCEEHDRHAACSQFITHTIGRILSHLNLNSTPIDTKGFETLLRLTENTVNDSFDLYYGLFLYNVNTTKQIENLDKAFAALKHELFGRLHDASQKRIAKRVPMAGTAASSQSGTVCTSSDFQPDDGMTKELPSFLMPPTEHQ